jgi:hypothetical protein
LLRLKLLPLKIYISGPLFSVSSKKKKTDAEVAQAAVEVSPELDVEELEGIGRGHGGEVKGEGVLHDT